MKNQYKNTILAQARCANGKPTPCGLGYFPPAEDGRPGYSPVPVMTGVPVYAIEPGTPGHHGTVAYFEAIKPVRNPCPNCAVTRNAHLAAIADSVVGQSEKPIYPHCYRGRPGSETWTYSEGELLA
jgi:hypothetical protein